MVDGLQLVLRLRMRLLRWLRVLRRIVAMVVTLFGVSYLVAVRLDATGLLRYGVGGLTWLTRVVIVGGRHRSALRPMTIFCTAVLLDVSFG